MENPFMWLIIGLLIACCVIPMIFMRKHKPKKTGGTSDDKSADLEKSPKE